MSEPALLMSPSERPPNLLLLSTASRWRRERESLASESFATHACDATARCELERPPHAACYK